MNRSDPRYFLRDRSGAVSVMAALSTLLLLAVAAIVIDTGSLYLARRGFQSTNDAAALAAVQNPANAAAIVADTFARNGYTGHSVSALQGTYKADESLSADARFTPGNSNVNAVRVNATIQSPAYFAPLFGLQNLFVVRTQSTAARVPTASFGAGTRLAELDAGLTNALLGQLWGSHLSLSLIDYQALLGANVEALTFLNILATQVGVSGSYQQLADTNVTTGQLLDALIQTAQTGDALTGNATAALLALRSLDSQLPGAPAMLLSNVVDLSPLYGRTIGNIPVMDGTGLTLNLMSLLSASARTLAKGRLVNLGTAVSVPVTNSAVGTRIAVGNQMARIADGQVGASVRTAQIRMALTATIASVNLGVATATVQAPIYIEAAQGQATLTAMPCQYGGTLAEITASSGAATAQFGAVSDAVLQDFSHAVVPTPVPAVSISLLGIPVAVGISGMTNVAASGPTRLSFSKADIDAKTLKSVPAVGVSPLTLLSTNLTLSTSILGNPGLLGAALNTALATLTAALRPVVANLVALLAAPIDSLMTTLGLQLGIVDVGVQDASCRTPTLVR